MSFSSVLRRIVGQDSVVILVTCYGLDDPGIESRWGARFCAHIQSVPGANPASDAMDEGSFLWVNLLGRGVFHPPPYSSDVKERIELYIYSSVPSWLVLGQIYLF